MKPVEATFQYCPKCGAKNEQAATNPFRCSKCEHVFYFSPTAAVGGIISDGDRILFLVRKKDPGKGLYGLPGGFVDQGEVLEESLSREVWEEASLKVCRSKYLCSFPNSYAYRGVDVPVIDMFFHCEVEDIADASADPDEVIEFKWLEPTDETLSKMAFESNRKAVKLFVERSISFKRT